MQSRPFCLVTALIALAAGLAPAQTAAPAAANASTNAPRYQSAIDAFAARDRKSPPPQNAVLFVGSSSIVMWKSLATNMAPTPVINRGFGGSVASDAVFHFDRLVPPYRPRQVFFYEGDNDIKSGRAPAAVLTNYVRFAELLAEKCPGTPLVIISVKPSPSRWSLREKYEELNRLLREYAAAAEGVDFVDVWTPMLGPDGAPRPELFLKDRLHMNADGYAIWTQAIRPLLKP